MKKLFSAILLLFSTITIGQVNLVPNPSFEIIDTCPYSQDQLNFAQFWFKPTPNSSDLYNRCATVYSSTVPANWTGWQQPRTGDGYAGIATYNCQDCREYLCTQLLAPLIFGRRYCVEFYASRADAAFWATNRLGMFISNLAPPDDGQIDTLTANPQICADTNQVFLDTMNWVKISGIYTASGGERYITIGNFYSDNQTDTIGNLGSFVWAYYYIDDVSVYEISNCVAGNNTTICYRDSIQLGAPPQPNVVYSWLPVDGLSNPNISNPNASPDTNITYTLTQMECDAVSISSVTITVDHGCHSAPTIIIPSILFGDQNLFISGLESNSKLELFDERGRLVFSQEEYQNGFWSTNLAQGMYVARLTRPNGEVMQQKVGVVK